MTRHRFLAVLVALVLLVTFSAAVAAQGPGQQGPGQQGPPSQTPPGHANPNAQDRAPPHAQGPPADPRDQRPGRAHAGPESVDGVYVRFGFNATQGVLHDYTVASTVFFSSVDLGGPFEVQARGAQVRVVGDDVRAVVVDNPTGKLRIEGTAVLHLAEGASAQANGSRIEVTAGNLSGFVRNATLEGDAIHAEDGLFYLHGPAVSTVARGATVGQERIAAAIAEGRVGGQFQVLPEGIEHLSFDNVTLASQRVSDDGFRFVVDANLTEGRVFVLDFAPGVLVSGQLGVKYYDEILGVFILSDIAAAGSLEEVLTLVPGQPPKYWINHAGGPGQGAQVLVAVPSFSIHAFEVLGIPEHLAPLIVYGVVFGVLFVLLAGTGLVLGRGRGAPTSS